LCFGPGVFPPPVLPPFFFFYDPREPLSVFSLFFFSCFVFGAFELFLGFDLLAPPFMVFRSTRFDILWSPSGPPILFRLPCAIFFLASLPFSAFSFCFFGRYNSPFHFFSVFLRVGVFPGAPRLGWRLSRSGPFDALFPALFVSFFSPLGRRNSRQP